MRRCTKVDLHWPELDETDEAVRSPCPPTFRHAPKNFLLARHPSVTMSPHSKIDVRPSDLDQAFVRVIVVSAVVLWSYANAPASTPVEALNYKYFTLAFIYWTFSLLAYGWTYLFIQRAAENSKKLLLARVLSIFADIGAISGYTAISGSFGVILFPVYLNSIIGYGYRFGVRYLYFTLAVAATFFSMALLQNPYISSSRELVCAYYLGMVLVPLYSASLLKKHRQVLERIRDINDARSRFIANVSHELRTPLHAIISVSDVLKETIDDVHANREGRHQKMQMIRDSAQHLLGLVNKILDVAAADAGRIPSRQRERTNLVAVAQTALRICQPKAQQQAIEFFWYFDADVPAWIMSSGEYLQEILINTVGNAVKYTQIGHVHVRFVLKKANDMQMLSVSIVDTGIGISSKFLPNIFEPFALGDDSAARRYSGTGLGLTLTKQYVEMLDGMIEFESVESCGTHCQIYLPIEECREDHPAYDRESCKVCFYLCASPLSATEAVAFAAAWWECKVITIARLHEIGSAEARVVFIDSELVDYHETIFRKIESGLHTLLFVCYGRIDASQVLHPRFNSAVSRGAVTQLRRIHVLESASLPYLDEEPDTAGAVATPVRVLLADDNPTNLTTARLALESVGHSVVCVSSGEDALSALDEENFGIAFIDMHMPGMSGSEVAQIYQFVSNSAAVPIIILTADATREARTAAEACGAAAFLTKPLRARELKDAVSSFAVGSLGKTVREAVDWEGDVQRRPILDVSEIDELMALGVGANELSEMVSEFGADSARLIDSAVFLHSQQDLVGYKEVMHALKGAAATLGAKRLSVYAHQLEHTDTQVRFDQDSDAVQSLRDLLVESLRLLHVRIGDGATMLARRD